MIRVLVERHLKKGKVGDLIPLLNELRTAALHQPGYVSGETLASAEDASIIMVLSTWRNVEDWRAWEKSETRIKLYKQIEPLLVEKPKVNIYRIAATEGK